MTSDEVLLHRYSQDGDPAAFRELIDRYAGMVYRIGLRVTGDQHMAEDLCQECFLELARKARTVRENIAGWLHASATSRSLNVVRSRKRRIHREQAVANDDTVVTESSEWNELQPFIDRALNGLSEELRLPIVLHYLQGQSQQQVADQLGVNQATMSRRLQRGVEQLRKRLRSFGVMTTIAAVTSFFGECSAQAASSSLTGSLAKIGLGGVGVSVAKSTSSALVPFLLTLGAVLSNLLFFLLVNGWGLVLFVVMGLVLYMRPPAWFRELLRAQAFGRDFVAHPTYPFRRWTWTIPPADWKQRLFVWLYVGFTFSLLAYENLARMMIHPGYVLAFGLMAMFFLVLAIRLAWRIWTLRKQSPTNVDPLSKQVPQWFSWELIVGASFFITIAATWLSSAPSDEIFSTSRGAILFWSWFLVCAGMAIWEFIERWRKRNSDDVSFNNIMSKQEVANTQPVAPRYHNALIGSLMLMIVGFLSIVMLKSMIISERPIRTEPEVFRYTQDGTRVRVEVPEAFKPPTPPKGLPSQLVLAASLGFIFSLLLFRRVVKVRQVVSRHMWLLFLALSSLIVVVGAGLTTNVIWATVTRSKVITKVDPPEVLPPRKRVFNPSPSQLALIQKYETESAIITVPEERLPEGWYLMRYDNGFASPMTYEDEKFHRHSAKGCGLPDVPELDSVVASLHRIYMNLFVLGKIDPICSVSAFCCGNADEARRLNHAWGDRGLRKGRLVIFVYGPKGLRPPSSTDQAPIPTILEHIQQSPVVAASEK
ncbi:sigma-70 family RNA polymerase sigma factor [uncultured Gimesia sp.]|uniref:RNA polymerase sigma factor n=1 Tax=uncultured Gimesia sp. TaxID=1678688 RepID=UPI00261314E3|nr:sigma-70 family RNA polymerase sigma factor [uncultured Gimesia sp.]